jgi:multicomponent Na+:H+ antiporter subunit F
MLKWLAGAIILAGIVTVIMIQPFSFLLFHDVQYIGFVGRAIFVIILASVLCLWRVWRGPTAADRIVAVDVFGIMIVGLCAVTGIATGRSWYIDIGIAWAVQSFVSTLALAKYLEGRDFDE